MENVTITEIEIFPIRPKEGLVAFASCLFNGALSLNSIAIYTRPDGSGYRLTYPTKILLNGKPVNCFYPINRKVGEIISEAIISKFIQVTEKVTITKGGSDESKYTKF